MPSNMAVIMGKIVKMAAKIVKMAAFRRAADVVVMPCKPENSVKNGPENSKAARRLLLGT